MAQPNVLCRLNRICGYTLVHVYYAIVVVIRFFGCTLVHVYDAIVVVISTDLCATPMRWQWSTPRRSWRKRSLASVSVTPPWPALCLRKTALLLYDPSTQSKQRHVITDNVCELMTSCACSDWESLHVLDNVVNQVAVRTAFGADVDVCARLESVQNQELNNHNTASNQTSNL